MPPPLNLIRRSKADASPISDTHSSPRKSPQHQASLEFSPARRRFLSLDDHPKIAASQRGISLSVIFLTLIAGVYIWHQQIILRAFARLQPSDGRNQIWTDVTTSIERPRQHHQEVIVIVGSPETGFGRLEKNLIQWTKDHLIRDYSYAIPDLSPKIYNATQGFHPLMESILYKVAGPPRGTSSFSRETMNKTETLLEEFRSAFNREWMKNKHFVIGADTFREISPDTRSRVIDALINLLPWKDKRYSLRGSNDDVTAIILYRQWRVAYLKSLWAAHVAQDDEQTFSTWIQNSKESYMHEIDPLHIADEFLEKGFKIAILDIDYIVSNKMNLSHYIACNILKEQCDTHGHLKDAGNNTKGTMKIRDRTEGLDMNEETLEKMRLVLTEGDCLYDYLLENDKVKFYPSKLRRKFEYCDVDPALGGLEYRWLKLLKEIH